MTTSRFDQLEAEIRRQYDVIAETIRFGPLEFELLRVADPDALLDDRLLAESHDELPWHPYWAQAWDAAYGVAWELVQRDLAGKRVLDLGCGLGITGIVAAARGATVVMADHAPPALLFAERNSWPWRHSVAVRRLDWRTDRLNERFDLIVGSDILYDRRDPPYLDGFWRHHLEDKGTVLLGDPNRAMTREFLAWLQTHQWLLTETTRQQPQSGATIRLVELLRQVAENHIPQ